MMDIEKLLKPRFKVMGPFPHMNCKVGDILDFSDGYSSKQLTRTPNDDPWGETNYTTHGFDEFELREYPNLFQLLPWHSDRKPEDMPEYVKCIKTPDQVIMPGNVLKVTWNSMGGKEENGNWIFPYTNCFEPATEEEYLVYVEQK